MDLSRFYAAPLVVFTATKEIDYGTEAEGSFHQDAVRIALKRKQVIDDLGVGMPTLNKRITAHRGMDVVSKEEAQENDRIRCENGILKEERAS